MKNILTLSLTLAALAGAASAASAAELKPYIGFDLQRTAVSYEDIDLGGGFGLDTDSLLKDRLDGLNIHVGTRFHRNAGVELGYFRTKNESKNIIAGDAIGPGVVAAGDFKTRTQLHGLTLDALGYLPLGETERFELIGTAGLSWTKGELSLNVPGLVGGSQDESEIGFRVGGGAQFNLTDQVNLRGLVRYQTADFEDIADRAYTYSVGLNYSF